MRKSLVCLLVFLLIAASIGVCMAYKATVSVESSIVKDGMNAKQVLGTFEVPKGGKAYGFSGGASIVNSNGVTDSHIFSIQKYDSPKNVVVFQRNYKGEDTPVNLANLILGPGKYVLAIGGYPGSYAKISFTLEY